MAGQGWVRAYHCIALLDATENIPKLLVDCIGASQTCTPPPHTSSHSKPVPSGITFSWTSIPCCDSCKSQGKDLYL